MSGGSIITYRKALKPFAKYTVHFQLVGSDKIWNFMKFEFYDNKGTLSATGYMKGAAVKKGGFVLNETSYALLGIEQQQAELPMAVQKWMQAEGCLLSDLKT